MYAFYVDMLRLNDYCIIIYPAIFVYVYMLTSYIFYVTSELFSALQNTPGYAKTLQPETLECHRSLIYPDNSAFFPKTLQRGVFSIIVILKNAPGPGRGPAPFLCQQYL